MITRSELKKLVKRRLGDAHVLMQGRRYESAYYIAGYAVECAIKACIARQFRRNTIPDRQLVNQTYKHDFEGLLKTAGLFDELRGDAGISPGLGSSWNVIKDWKPDVRYSTEKTRLDAHDLIDAIENPDDGILQWLARHCERARR